MPKLVWSEILESQYRMLCAEEIPVDVFGVDAQYGNPKAPCAVTLIQTYTRSNGRFKPKHLSWSIQVPASPLLAEHIGGEFNITIHLPKGKCKGRARYHYNEELKGGLDKAASMHGTSELDGLFEAGLCVPEIQNLHS